MKRTDTHSHTAHDNSPMLSLCVYVYLMAHDHAQLKPRIAVRRVRFNGGLEAFLRTRVVLLRQMHQT